MPRPRKPTNVLQLAGAFKKDPRRALARINEPPPEGDMGDPPDHLTDEERLCWLELVGLCHAGVLCRADRAFVEYASRVWAQIRTQADFDPKLGIRFEAICSKLGMTPADRSRVQMTMAKPSANPYEEFGGN